MGAPKCNPISRVRNSVPTKTPKARVWTTSAPTAAAIYLLSRARGSPGRLTREIDVSQTSAPAAPFFVHIGARGACVGTRLRTIPAPGWGPLLGDPPTNPEHRPARNDALLTNCACHDCARAMRISSAPAFHCCRVISLEYPCVCVCVSIASCHEGAATPQVRGDFRASAHGGAHQPTAFDVPTVNLVELMRGTAATTPKSCDFSPSAPATTPTPYGLLFKSLSRSPAARIA